MLCKKTDGLSCTCTWNFITTLMFCIYPDSPSPQSAKCQLLGVERMHFVNIKQVAVFLSGQETNCEFFSLEYIEMRHEHTQDYRGSGQQ
jgi:hypothetical protein